MTEVIREPSSAPRILPDLAPAADSSRTVSCSRESLEALSIAEGLGFDDQDLTYYADLYQNVLKREATREELFDLAQGNSEHSRHWFFGGNLKLDGKSVPHSLFSLVKRPIKALEAKGETNSTIAFHDNASAIRGLGRPAPVISPVASFTASPLRETTVETDITYTCETHNFPTGVCPFEGAGTGAGGRLRDGQAAGQGSIVQAAIAGYSVGNLHLDAPWEQEA